MEITMLNDSLAYNTHMTLTRHFKAQTNIITKLKKQLRDPVVDLSCGTGHLLSQLKIFQLNDLIGIDNNKNMVAFARKQTQLNIVQQNLFDLNLTPYNTLICANTLFYVDSKSFFKKCNKELNKNAKLIIMEENPFIIPQGKFNYTQETLDLMNIMSIEQIIKLAIKNKLKLMCYVETNIDSKHKLYGLVFTK